MRSSRGWWTQRRRKIDERSFIDQKFVEIYSQVIFKRLKILMRSFHQFIMITWSCFQFFHQQRNHFKSALKRTNKNRERSALLPTWQSFFIFCRKHLSKCRLILFPISQLHEPDHRHRFIYKLQSFTWFFLFHLSSASRGKKVNENLQHD